VRMTRLALLFPLLLLPASAVRAEYIVLRSGQRLRVTGYQLLGDKYRLQLSGGFVEMPAGDVMAIEPEEVFTSTPVLEAANAPFRELIQAAAARYRVDADLITSIIATESNFDPKAISRHNARGLMQLLPQTAARLGVQNIFDPGENIDAGTRYLRELLQRYRNDLALTLAAYNAGPARVRQYGRVPPFTETQSYVRRVRNSYNKRKSGVAVGKAPAQALGVSSTPDTGAPPG
jgi:soluble lytic murein transglycosylase-like protein